MRAPRREPPPGSPVSDIAARLRAALDSFDDQAAHAALDRLFATVSVEAALAEVLIPYLHDLGKRWRLVPHRWRKNTSRPA